MKVSLYGIAIISGLFLLYFLGKAIGGELGVLLGLFLVFKIYSIVHKKDESYFQEDEDKI